MAPFSTADWLLLGFLGGACVLGCLRTLAIAVHRETKLHALKVRAAELRIEHLRSLRRLHAESGIGVVDEDDVIFAEIVDENDAEVSKEPVAAAA